MSMTIEIYLNLVLKKSSMASVNSSVILAVSQTNLVCRCSCMI